MPPLRNRFSAQKRAGAFQNNRLAQNPRANFAEGAVNRAAQLAKRGVEGVQRVSEEMKFRMEEYRKMMAEAQNVRAEEYETMREVNARQRRDTGALERKIIEAFSLEGRSRVDLRARFLAELVFEMFGEKAVQNPAFTKYILTILKNEFSRGSQRLKSNPQLLEAFRELKTGSKSNSPRQVIAQEIQEILQEHQGQLARFGVQLEG